MGIESIGALGYSGVVFAKQPGHVHVFLHAPQQYGIRLLIGPQEDRHCVSRERATDEGQ